jgi:hypothetical protein
MKLLLIICTVSILPALYGQGFEGKIVYLNQYSSKMADVTTRLMETMLGTQQQYFIRDGDYKSVSNGSFVHWQLYLNSENRLYNKTAGTNDVAWTDGTKNDDTILRAAITPKAMTVLGYDCDELLLTCSSGTQRYYFNSSIAVNPALFVNHQYGNWYAVVNRTHALPLKTIVETSQFRLESTATSVTPLKLADSLFVLPANVHLTESPGK